MPTPELTPQETEVLNGLDPAFGPWIIEARRRVWARGVAFRLRNGLRSRTQQAAERAARPEAAVEPGKSKHEIGFAVDIEGPTNQDQWRIVAEETRRLGLESGIDYRPVAEPWHIEAPITRKSLATYRVLTMMVALGAFAIGWGAVTAVAQEGT